MSTYETCPSPSLSAIPRIFATSSSASPKFRLLNESAKDLNSNNVTKLEHVTSAKWQRQLATDPREDADGGTLLHENRGTLS